MKKLLCLLLLSSPLFAGDAKPIPDATEVKLLKAQQALNEVQTREREQQILLDRYTQAVQKIQLDFPALQEEEKNALQALEVAKDSACKEAGLGKPDCNPDIKSSTFIPKPTAPASAPTAAAK
jgi:hypothetical protein